MTADIHTGDVLEWAKNYDGEPFHAALMDAPYHYTSTVKRFDKENSAPAQYGTDGAFRRMSKGFCGHEWDGVDENGDGVAMRKETWIAIAKHLLPGAFLLVCAGTLNDDMISLAMREAGLIKHHSLYWAHGQGFPKATQIKGDVRFSGHRYGRQSIKPAVETILCFQVPYKGRPLDCITATGAGNFNIDAGRIGTESRTVTRGRGSAADIFGSGGERNTRQEYEAGRWPSNFLLSAECAAGLDAMSGQSTGKAGNRGLQTSGQHGGLAGANPNYKEGSDSIRGHTDSGGASRFFHISDWNAEEHDPYFYCAKSGRGEREAGLDRTAQTVCKADGLSRDMNSKNSGNPIPLAHNNHPCVKPLKLVRYLASLLLPPAEYAPRRLLVPFSGSGSEMIGALLAGWEFVQGIEMSAEYAAIAAARIAFWQMNSGLFEEIVADTEDAPDPITGDLFAGDRP